MVAYKCAKTVSSKYYPPLNFEKKFCEIMNKNC